MQFKEIPRKVIVAKRLAQCLNPALPTGVHQRALDVYAHILAVLGVRDHSRLLDFLPDEHYVGSLKASNVTLHYGLRDYFPSSNTLLPRSRCVPYDWLDCGVDISSSPLC